MRGSIIIRAPHALSSSGFSSRGVSFAGFGSRRPPLAPVALVVLLMTALFAGAILAALQPPPLVDAMQASVQGGL